MLQNRAYSLLSVKSFEEDSRIITGIATTPSTDRMGDTVDPKGAEFSLPVALLWQHDAKQPIGHVTKAKVTADGIEIEARLVKIDEPGALKNRLDEAWLSLKSGLVKGLSIGFSAIEYAFTDTGIHFQKWSWLELSAVTIPANADASVLSLKQFDTGRPAASGISRPVVHLSGASDISRASARKAPDMKTTAEKKAAFVAEREAKLARLNAIDEAANGQTLDAAQQEEFDTLEAEMKSITDHIARLDRLEQMNKSVAAPVTGSSSAVASQERSGTTRIVGVKSQLPPGIRFARAAMCIGMAKGSFSDALALASQHYGDDAGITAFIKAAVGGATTSNHQGPDLQYTDLLSEFIDYLRPMTILGKLGTAIPGPNGGTYPNVTPVPFNVRVGTQTAGGTASWVGQGLPTPLTKGTFGTATLDFAKLSTIQVATKEELRFTAISAEMKLRNDLAKSIAAKSDVDFVDPTNAGTANVKPAAVTYGVAATAVSGTTAAALRVDLKNMLGTMLAAGIQPTSLVLIMSQGIALSLSLMRNSLGMREFPDLTMNGGYVEGIPVIASEHVTALGSPSTNMIVGLNASDVFMADDGEVTIEASDQASLEMLDGSMVQSGTAGTGTSLVSLWQTGMVGFKATRAITWKLMRSSSCQYLSGVAYVPS